MKKVVSRLPFISKSVVSGTLAQPDRLRTVPVQLFYFLLFTFYLASCAKIEPMVIDEPAYLRVFNNLNFRATIDNQEQALSTMTMLIDPEYGPDGLPIDAETIGDFLVTRNPYAPPYPEHIGWSVDMYNPEYPGKEPVIAGPILNGFDLSSWAQVPSGSKRIVFYARPRNEVSFFQLEARYRSTPLIDTVLNLHEREVYTLHVLEKDYNIKETGVLLRQENFHKLALADSLVYVNFYNMSAKGFWQANEAGKPQSGNYIVGTNNQENNVNRIRVGIKDEMNVYYSIYDRRASPPNPISAHNQVFLTPLIRDTESTAVAPYHSLPLFTGDQAASLRSFLVQSFLFMAPQYSNKISQLADANFFSHSELVHIICLEDGRGRWSSGAHIVGQGVALPSLIVNTHSGVHNPRSFSTVNSIEIVNGTAYLTTVQRVYDPPQY